jgi:hypothetical protein
MPNRPGRGAEGAVAQGAEATTGNGEGTDGAGVVEQREPAGGGCCCKGSVPPEPDRVPPSGGSGPPEVDSGLPG